MNYIFIPMNKEYATTIVDTWKYENEYSIYDCAHEAEHLLDSEGWGRGIFAVLSQDGDLVGELSSSLTSRGIIPNIMTMGMKRLSISANCGLALDSDRIW
jgi:hypothetical protein